jgi:hypothetical protein
MITFVWLAMLLLPLLELKMLPAWLLLAELLLLLLAEQLDELLLLLLAGLLLCWQSYYAGQI